MIFNRLEKGKSLSVWTAPTKNFSEILGSILSGKENMLISFLES
jgi:hypothetical protein